MARSLVALSRRRAHRAAGRRQGRSFRPHVEVLEVRLVPSLISGNEVPLVSSNNDLVAVAPDGHFVTFTETGDFFEQQPVRIWARVYAPGGAAQTAPIQVNTDTAVSIRVTGAAVDAQGDFVVAWSQALTGTPYEVVEARRFNAPGQPLGGVFQVSQSAVGADDVPQVAIDARGDFVVAWTRFNAHDTTLPAAVFARLYDSAGTARGGEFEVSQATTSQQEPAVAMNAQGEFVVSWTDHFQGTDARAYNAAGQPLSDAVAVVANNWMSGSGAVAMDSAGDFVVAYRDNSNGISVRRSSATGVLSNPLQVGPPTGDSLGAPAVAMDAQGGFVVAWDRVAAFPFPPLPPAPPPVPPPGGGPGAIGEPAPSPNTIEARRFNAAGQDVSGMFQVNQTAGDSDSPTAAMDATGNFTIAWRHAASPGPESIEARHFTQTTTGYSYDPRTRTLTITAAGGNHSFAFSQAAYGTSGSFTRTFYTFTLDGIAQTYDDETVAHVAVRFSGSGNTASLDTKSGNNVSVPPGGPTPPPHSGFTVSLGQQGGTVYRSDGSVFLRLAGFGAEYATVGPNDIAQLVATAGVPNTLVTAGHSSYLQSANAYALFNGASYLRAYAAGPADRAYQYDGSGPSTFVAVGDTYSSMAGTDGGTSFDNEARGFAFNEGIARHAGLDTAYLYDSPGNDIFVGNTTLSYLYRENATNTALMEYDIAEGFAQVHAASVAGGVDYAYVYDASVNRVTGFHR